MGICISFFCDGCYSGIKINTMENPPRVPAAYQKDQKIFHFFNENYNLFLHYAEGHPLNSKERFFIAKVRIFGEDQMFQKDLYSTDCLSSLDQEEGWSHSFFVRLLRSWSRFDFIPKESHHDAQDVEDHGFKLHVRDEDGSLLLFTEIEPDFTANLQACFWK